MKRFYKQVEITAAQGGFQVTLDGRPVKTVQGHAQIAPTRALAEALAGEWDAQGETIDPASLPRRDMADYAIDVVAASPEGLVDKLTAYGDTDTLLYRADPDEPLYARQMQVWEPIVTTFEAREGVSLKRISGVIHARQSDEALAAMRSRLARLDPFQLAGTEAMVSLAASLIIGLAASEADADADALSLWRAASLEEEWQADLWGRDEEAEARTSRREADFLTACHFVQLAAG